MIFNWEVLARQAALILVPLLLSWLRLPQSVVDMISGPVADRRSPRPSSITIPAFIPDR